MRSSFLGVFLLLSIPLSALAYLPPSFFVVEKITADRNQASSVLAQVTVLRAAPNQNEADELLWEQYVLSPSPSKQSAAWPGLSILLESEPARLSSAFELFGLPVVGEEALARFKSDQLRAMKETPRPFYNMDPNMSLRKDGRQLAWVLASTDNARSLWIDKSSFFPLFLRGPCPEVVEEISWAKSSDAPCELHFASASGLKTSAGKHTAAVLRRNGQPLIKFVLKKVFFDPQPTLVKSSLEKNAKAADDADDLYPLVADFLN